MLKEKLCPGSNVVTLRWLDILACLSALFHQEEAFVTSCLLFLETRFLTKMQLL